VALRFYDYWCIGVLLPGLIYVVANPSRSRYIKFLKVKFLILLLYDQSIEINRSRVTGSPYWFPSKLQILYI
jgi:hypothetical protein